MSAVRSSRFFMLLWCLFSSKQILGYSNLTKNDPYPMYTAMYPYTYLTTNLRDYYKGIEAIRKQEHVQISISPFRQAATVGRNINKHTVNLGDLVGPWNMIALFYPTGDIPSQGNTLVQQTLLNALSITPADLETTCSSISPLTLNDALTNPSRTDPQQQFGFFSVPIKYRKWGVRFDAEFYLGADIGIKIQTGVTDLIQTASFTDLTCQAVGRSCPVGCAAQSLIPTQSPCCDIDQIGCDCKRLVMNKIMDQLDIIADTLQLSTCNFNQRSADDTRISLYWRHVYPINQERESWPYFLLMPFVALEVIAPTSKRIDPNCLFALPAGNNGHTGLGFSAGINIEFVETIEIGCQASMTEWFSRRYFNYPVPVNEFQCGMYPYKADLTIRPSTNWTFSALMNSHHFLDRLSVYAQWVAVYHGRDCFTNVVVHPFTPGFPGILPPIPPASQEPIPEAALDIMANNSRWNSHVINVGATYDISPNIALGLLWQTPVSRQNAYRSTTILGSFIVTW